MYRISTLLLALLIVTGVSAGVNVGSLTTEGLSVLSMSRRLIRA